MLPALWACAVVAVHAQAQRCPSSAQCTELTRCPSALQVLKEGGGSRPQHCGFSARSYVPNVCCPRTTSTPSSSAATCSGGRRHHKPPPKPSPVTCEQLPKFLADTELDSTAAGRMSRSMCRKFQEDLCALPAETHIPPCPAFGRSADILEFPHMALLGYGDSDDIHYACGGSLISHNFILTAAHCAEYIGQPVRWALLGATNRITSEPKEYDTHQLIQVAEVIVHPGHSPPAKYHDIALVRLARSVNMSMETVKPACLHTDVDARAEGQEAVATGWGATFFGDEGSETLIKVNLTVRPLQFCKDKIELDPEKAPQGLLDEQLCAGGDDVGRDTCEGDSGGPIQVRANPDNTKEKPCIHRILGVVSFGPPCGLGKPGVYTRVAAYVPWIESVVWPTRSDGCSYVVSGADGEDIQIPNSGPGSVARGMCRVYHVNYCEWYMADLTHVKPDLSVDSRCHHFQPPASSKDRGQPTIVTLRYGSSAYNHQYACGGALISPRAVLTAARCARLGCLPVSVVNMYSPESCADAGMFEVESVHVHPDYRQGRAYADLAVLLLKKSADIRDFFPLCLHTPAHPQPAPGQRAPTHGYNIENSWEHARFTLADSTLTVHSQPECGASLLGEGRLRRALPQGLLDDAQFCAGGLCDNQSYAGDSGVPIAVRSHVLQTHHALPHFVDNVMGVASSLTYCTASAADGQRLPDLFTMPAHYIGWIERVVWGHCKDVESCDPPPATPKGEEGEGDSHRDDDDDDVD